MLISSVALVGNVFASEPPLLETIDPINLGLGAPLDVVGEIVSLDGDYLIASASGDDPTGTAYVLKRPADPATSWQLLQKLLPSIGRIDGVALDDQTAVTAGWQEGEGVTLNFFGQDIGGSDNWGFLTSTALAAADGAVDVAIDGDLVVVGALGTAEVYLLGRDVGGPGNWGLITQLLSSDPQPGGYGEEVVVQGNRVYVAAPDAAKVYVFEGTGADPSNWLETAVLSSEDDDPNERFGASISADGDTLLVGAPGAINLVRTGAAYVFTNTIAGWQEDREILADDIAVDDQFGSRVSLAGDRAVVSSSRDNGVGAVYVFEQDQGGTNNWGQIDKIRPQSGETGFFGDSDIVTDGQTVAVGHPAAVDPVSLLLTSGAVIFHEPSGDTEWLEQSRFFPGDSGAGHRFGSGLSINGDQLLIGVPGDLTALGSGRVALYLKDSVGSWLPNDAFISDGAASNFGGSLASEGQLLAVAADEFVNVYDPSSGPLLTLQPLQRFTGAVIHEFVRVGLADRAAAIGTFDPSGDPNGCNQYSYQFYQQSTIDPGQWTARPELDGVAFALDGDLMVRYDRTTEFSFCQFVDRVFEVRGRDVGGSDNWGVITELPERADVMSLQGDRLVTMTEQLVGPHIVKIFQRNVGGADNWGEIGTVELGLEVAQPPIVQTATQIAIGAPLFDVDGPMGPIAEAGAVYLLEPIDPPAGSTTGWSLAHTLLAGEPEESERFGTSLATSDGQLFIGAPGKDGIERDEGRVYIFGDENPIFADGFE